MENNHDIKFYLQDSTRLGNFVNILSILWFPAGCDASAVHTGLKQQDAPRRPQNQEQRIDRVAKPPGIVVEVPQGFVAIV